MAQRVSALPRYLHRSLPVARSIVLVFCSSLQVLSYRPSTRPLPVSFTCPCSYVYLVRTHSSSFRPMFNATRPISPVACCVSRFDGPLSWLLGNGLTRTASHSLDLLLFSLGFRQWTVDDTDCSLQHGTRYNLSRLLIYFISPFLAPYNQSIICSTQCRAIPASRHTSPLYILEYCEANVYGPDMGPYRCSHAITSHG
ncbi:hypothetical protein PENSPDRAFT_269487 [Peniophora sp. CONT]|nr:hypothetical protein PENSPDRAFT_269487 [Peniophora sp. CONT]